MYGYNIFHEGIMDTLINAVRQGRSPHSYIFEGESGMGKHTSADLLAACIVCENSISPCGTCKSCIMAKAKTHPDIKYILPENNKKTIGVESIRSMSADAIIKPFYSLKKVYIIEGDLLTAEAQNAFLKTLEEPPLYAVFIIITTDISKLLGTIISRCTHINFGSVCHSRMEKHLHEKYPELADKFRFYISYASGNPGRLSTLIESPEFLLLRDECYKAVSEILSNEYNDAFNVSSMFDENKDSLLDVLDIIFLFLRDILFIQEGLSTDIVNSDYLEKLRHMAMSVDLQKVLAAMEKIPLCGEMQKRNISAKYIGMYLALCVKEEQN